jgi:hypothetical protein
MIISHKHRFIFFAVPKTGTHSVRQALRKHLGPDDLEQVGLFVQKRFSFPELENFKSGHVSAMQIQPILGNDVYHDYFKFAFVRNPFDRFVSYCAFMSRTTGEFVSRPRDFMKHVIIGLNPVDHLLYKPQYEFLVDHNGQIAVDFIGRNESMQASYDKICQTIGMPSTKLELINSTEHRPFMEYYDDETYGLVSNLYRKDLELFGYR